MHKRILLKLSGEQLQGDQSSGFDSQRAKWIVEEIRKAKSTGAEIVIMVGGGNYARGAQLADSSIQRITGDNIGMLATMMNALALQDVFNSEGLESRALTNVTIDQFLDRFTHRRATHHLKKGRVVIVAGGTGRPFLTTDTAAVNLALELNCEVVIKATKVDGVYDKDPAKYPSAVKYDELSHQEALEDPDVSVMDKAALGLAMEQGIKVMVCELLKEDNIKKAVMGDSVGTLVS